MTKALPVASDMLPELPLSPVSRVKPPLFATLLPPVEIVIFPPPPSLPNPDLIVTPPPSSPLLPAEIDTLPPSPADSPDVPAAKRSPPLAPTLLSPVRIDTSPVRSPPELSPVFIVKAPLAEFAVSPVKTLMSPEEELKPLAVADREPMLIDPDALEPSLLPLLRIMLPPVATELSPAAMTILPPGMLDASPCASKAPTRIVIPPATPSSVLPVCKLILPEDPEAALPVETSTIFVSSEVGEPDATEP
jgi:hypothetical protein